MVHRIIPCPVEAFGRHGVSQSSIPDVIEMFGVAGQKGMRWTQRHPEDSKITYFDKSSYTTSNGLGRMWRVLTGLKKPSSPNTSSNNGEGVCPSTSSPDRSPGLMGPPLPGVRTTLSRETHTS